MRKGWWLLLAGVGVGVTAAAVTAKTKATSVSVSLSAYPVSGVAPLAVSFTVKVANPPSDAYSVLMDFGDGSPAEVLQGSTAHHTYDVPGTYAATATLQGAGIKVTSNKVAIQATSVPSGGGSGGGVGGTVPAKIVLSASQTENVMTGATVTFDVVVTDSSGNPVPGWGGPSSVGGAGPGSVVLLSPAFPGDTVGIFPATDASGSASLQVKLPAGENNADLRFQAYTVIRSLNYKQVYSNVVDVFTGTATPQLYSAVVGPNLVYFDYTGVVSTFEGAPYSSWSEWPASVELVWGDVDPQWGNVTNVTHASNAPSSGDRSPSNNSSPYSDADIATYGSGFGIKVAVPSGPGFVWWPPGFWTVSGNTVTLLS